MLNAQEQEDIARAIRKKAKYDAVNLTLKIRDRGGGSGKFWFFATHGYQGRQALLTHSWSQLTDKTFDFIAGFIDELVKSGGSVRRLMSTEDLIETVTVAMKRRSIDVPIHDIENFCY